MSGWVYGQVSDSAIAFIEQENEQTKPTQDAQNMAFLINRAVLTLIVKTTLTPFGSRYANMSIVHPSVMRNWDRDLDRAIATILKHGFTLTLQSGSNEYIIY